MLNVKTDRNDKCFYRYLICFYRFVKEKLFVEIHTEIQLLFLCHLVGPFLQRFNSDVSRVVMDITITLYELLAHIDKTQTHLQYIDPICDLLYPFYQDNVLFTKLYVNLKAIINSY